MFYEIEGIGTIPPMSFEDDQLVTERKTYPYDQIKDLYITNSAALSPYAILKVKYDGGVDSVPFNRHRLKVVKHAIKEWRLLQTNKEKKQPTDLDPYQQIKELKELLDMDAITQEEYDKKKKELLDL